jgi:hypothetical protein
MGRDVGHPGAQELPQLLLGGRLRGDDRLDAVDERVDQLLVGEQQELLLAVDVVVEAAALEARRLDQVVDRGVAVAALGEQPRRDGDYLPPPPLVAIADARVTGLMPGSSRTSGCPLLHGHR